MLMLPPQQLEDKQFAWLHLDLISRADGQGVGVPGRQALVCQAGNAGR
jgi:hypothetical protein